MVSKDKMTTCQSCGSMFPYSHRWVQMSYDGIEIRETLWVCMDCGLNNPDLGAIPASSWDAMAENLRVRGVYHGF